MAYFLLLALVFTVSFIFLLPTHSQSSRSQTVASLAAGLVFLSLGFLTQLVLGLHLDNSSAQLFYWARETMALAWFGHAALLLLFGDKPQMRWLTYVLLAGGLLSFILIGATQVTKAEDWFRPQTPIYAQIGDLLATNRPTRWGGWLLNAYGGIALVGCAGYLLSFRVKRKLRNSVTTPILLAAGAVALLLPIVWPPQESSAIFYLVELAGPMFLCFGFGQLLTFPKAQPKKRRVKR